MALAEVWGCLRTTFRSCTRQTQNVSSEYWPIARYPSSQASHWELLAKEVLAGSQYLPVYLQPLTRSALCRVQQGPRSGSFAT